ncbi:probable methyltransferase TARBP1 [Linepithema humile]|uniref:probable methyltransferase TARBP1 n=1 Tax=Linepithema humile TaxID=83485 RepID=UPI00351E3037
MDLHNRYLHSPSLNISVLQPDDKCKNGIFVELHHLIQLHNREMIEEKLDINKLEICRMLLCYEYQLIFKDIENQDDEKDMINKKYVIPADAEQTRFSSIGAIFPPEHLRSTLEILVLHDIIILQMVLYYDIKSIKKHLQSFLNSSNTYIAKSNTRVMYMKILEYVLESLHLHQFLHNFSSDSEEDLKELGSIYLEIVKSWMKVKEDHEWKVFASMLLVLTKTFTPESILFPLWDYIMNEINDLKERLTVLSLVVDACFASSDSMDSTYIHRDIYTSNTFWSLILTGLQSPVQQCRKQALYIMKRAVNSVSKVCVQNFAHLKLTKAQITPFICSESHATALHPIDNIKQKFFLIYEALEESQYHLVTPALTYVASLVQAYKERKSCKECFDIVWLQCILEKVLQHKNNNIVKWGVLYTCKLNESSVFNDQFLDLFVNVLNNAFLYEFHPDEECPEIVKELSTFFTCTEERNLLNRFLKKVSEVTWSPIAIFYIIHTLQTLQLETIKYNNWRAAELKAIKTLVETNLNMHSHILRIASQTELLKAISNYVLQIDDLILFANTLASFPAGEGLVRGTVPWIAITTRLQKALLPKDAKTFVENTCETYLRTCNIENVGSKFNPRTFALMVYLLHDANLILSDRTCPTKKSLNNWLSILNGVNLRPYVDLRSTMDAIEFISHLLNFSVTGSSGITMKDLILLYLHTTFNILIQNMRKISKKMTYEDYTRYVSIVSLHIVNAGLLMPERDVNNYAEKLQRESILLLKDTIEQTNSSNDLQCLYALHILHLSQNIMVSLFARTFYEEYLLNTDNYPTFLMNSGVTNLKGKIASAYYQLLAKLLHQYLTINPKYSLIPFTDTISKLLSKLLSFLEFGGPEIASEIALILTVIIDNAVVNNASDKVTLKDIFQLCWKHAFAGKRNNTFWTTIQNLTGVIVNDMFLLFPKATKFAMQFIEQLLEEGENTPKFHRILLSKMAELREDNLIQLSNVLFTCISQGFLRRDKRVEYHTHLFIAKHLGQIYYPKRMLELDCSNDAEVRAQAIILLYKLIIKDSRIQNPGLDFAEISVSFILEILNKYRNKRYFNDSFIHKLKQRVMQILLILEPILNEEHIVLLQENIFDLIFSEDNQHSVRLMQEWFLILIFRKNTHLHNKLWKYFAESMEKRPGCTISIASIIYHVARLLSNDSQKSFIQTALPHIVQCCLGQQFNMRLYNQFILVQLCDLMKKVHGDDSISEYKGIYQAAMVNLQQGFLTKNSVKIQDDFYFSHFHPINDYSLQSIYFEFPRLTNMSRDEWISPDVFKNLKFKQSDNHSLQLYNIDSFLSEAKFSIYSTKSLAGDTESVANNVETDFEGLHDIQKKIVPSKPTATLYNNFDESLQKLYQQDLHQCGMHEGLIVVASFITRLPNLGGIARTCEIFGVKTLVLANLACVKDKEFQCLSVSAEKWINVIQVKPQELQEYLMQKKDEGWSLIGIEQTANSTNLLETKFNRKTILILGNEKDGIPANFIPLFDMCVEIPQAGITRSLNVHVTAAICIWQYVNQYMLK